MNPVFIQTDISYSTQMATDSKWQHINVNWLLSEVDRDSKARIKDWRLLPLGLDKQKEKERFVILTTTEAEIR